MAFPVRWGVLGPGRIAGKFVEALRDVPGATLGAVASRAQERAQAFADKYGAAAAYGDYAALAEDPRIDAVYVASPHVCHEDHATLCLRAGKAVLCEKPIFINAAGTARMADCARAHKAFLMEAMWTRFLPVTRTVCRWLGEKAIGDVRLVTADLAFRGGWEPQGRLLNPELGGGALLDVGIYTLSYTSMILGRALAVSGQAHIGETGVDEYGAYVLRHANDALSRQFSGVRVSSPHVAQIIGTEGQIVVEKFWNAPSATLKSRQGDAITEATPHRCNGFEYEIEEVHRCLEAGLPESPLLPLAENIAILEVCDRLRAAWGLVYPLER